MSKKFDEVEAKLHSRANDDEAIIRGLQEQARREQEENGRLRVRVMELEEKILKMEIRLRSALDERPTPEPARKKRGPYDLDGDPYAGG